jgi:tRNA pseudouridine55 synthase
MNEPANTWMGFPVYDKSNWPPDPEAIPQGGVVLVDKHLGATSFTIVRKLRRFLGIKKVGHAGTLDPAAEGLLIVCFGKATKTIEHIQELPKTYVSGILLGRETPSYDRETPISEELPYDHVTPEMVEAAIHTQFTGEISQVPPVYSALKVDGQPLYKKARKGEHIVVQPRNVTIYGWKPIRIDLPLLLYEITSSKGTYIRSLAHDIGRALGTCGTLASLRRTHTGHFCVERALIISDYEVVR